MAWTSRKAIACARRAPADAIYNQMFNVGDNGHNYRVKEIAEKVAKVFPGCTLAFGTQGADNRSYRVNFDKISKACPSSNATGTRTKARSSSTSSSARST